jgi:hypothetical protein
LPKDHHDDNINEDWRASSFSTVRARELIMSLHRFFAQERSEPAALGLPGQSTGGFIVYPLLWPQPAAGPAPLLQQVYQLALEQAQQAARASRWQRYFAFSRN